MVTVFLSLIDDANDRSSFEKIYNQCAEDVFKRVYFFLKNQQDTEDVMQNVWLRVAQNIEMYREKEEKSARAYILRMAKNQAISMYRMKKRDVEHRCDADLARLFDCSDSDSMIFDLCNKMDVDMICECIRSMNEIYRDVLAYYYLQEYSVKEISKILGVKEITVRKRLDYGRAKLFQMLERRNLNVK